MRSLAVALGLFAAEVHAAPASSYDERLTELLGQEGSPDEQARASLEIAQAEEAPILVRSDAAFVAVGASLATSDVDLLCDVRAAVTQILGDVALLDDARTEHAEQLTRLDERVRELGSTCAGQVLKGMHDTGSERPAAEHPEAPATRVQDLVAPTPPPQGDRTARNLTIASAPLIGLGLASFAGSLATWMVWRSKVDQLRDLTDAANQAGGTTPAMDLQFDRVSQELQAQEQTYQRAYYATIAAGTMLAATGVALLVAGQARRRLALRAAISPTYAGVGLHGRF